MDVHTHAPSAAQSMTRWERLRTSKGWQRNLRHAGSYALLLAGSAFMLFPMLWIISASFKPGWQIFTQPPIWIPQHWEEVRAGSTNRMISLWQVEVDGEPLPLPRRERHILEFLAKNAHRRVTKTQIFNAVYGPFEEKVDEIVVEGHVSKLRKKLRLLLGSDVIDAKRYLGYQFVGCRPESDEIPPHHDAPETAAEPFVERAPALAMA